MKKQKAADEVDGGGQLVLLVDLWLLGDDVEELVLDNWDQVTSNALLKLWRSLSLYRLSPSCW